MNLKVSEGISVIRESRMVRGLFNRLNFAALFGHWHWVSLQISETI